MWLDLTATVEQAVAVAEEIGDPVLVAEAAICDDPGRAVAVGGARRGARRHRVGAAPQPASALPDDDSPLRCRCMLEPGQRALLRHHASPSGARCIDEALAMARRLGRPGAAAATPARSRSSPSGRPARPRSGSRWHGRGVRLAREIGDEQATRGSSLCLRAVALGELGRAAEMWATVAEARAEAERLRIALRAAGARRAGDALARDGRRLRASARSCSPGSARPRQPAPRSSTPRTRSPAR